MQTAQSPTDRAELNARAARLAGWRYQDDDTNPHWYHPLRLYAPLDAPPYCSSLDLIRRDLLPLLEKVGKQDAFTNALSRHMGGLTFFGVLAAPPEVILRAVLEVLEVKNA